MSVVVNLGCGTRASAQCVNYDWTPYARLAQYPSLAAGVAPLLGRRRSARLRALVGLVDACDLRRGIPLPDASVDGVYSSHVLEHFDRSAVGPHLREVLRVLRPGGVIRLVVPDLQQLAEAYLEAVNEVAAQGGEASLVEERVGAMIEQSVRRRSRAVPERAPEWLASVATLVFGDARRRGETHQWMWDEVTLGAALTEAGFVDVVRVDCATSRIQSWDSIDLDRDGGQEYKPHSLYLEASRRASPPPSRTIRAT